MNEAPALLIVAISARALVASARRAGYAAVAIDAFGDEDTRAASRATTVVENAMGGFAEVDLLSVVTRLNRDHAPVGLVYGSGFDDCPERLAQLGGAPPLLGSAPEALARTKNPEVFAEACAEAGIAHPEIRFAPPETPAEWLVKREGGSGGLHIAEGSPGMRLGPREYWQRRKHGRTVSLLFVRDSRELTLLAWSEQWTSPCPGAPFRYGGAAGPLDVSPPDRLLPGLVALTGSLGIRGLASADFLDDGETWWLLEINPRPGATLDVFDDADDPLLTRHLAAFADRPAPPPKPRRPKAAEIVYAPLDAIVPQADWPDWVADRPTRGSRLHAGAPVCTVFASGATVAEAKAMAKERSLRIQSWLHGDAI